MKKGVFLQRILTLLFSIVFPLSLFSATVKGAVADAGNVAGFEGTTVIQDLTGSVINGKEFNLDDFGEKKGKNIELLTFAEFGYNFYSDKQSDYGLYFYLYNPEKLEISDSKFNKISMAVGAGNTQSYFHYHIKRLNDYENLLIKFKVDLTEEEKKNILSNVSKEERVYKTGEIEFIFKGNSKAEAKSFPGRFSFTGFSKGYGQFSAEESTLKSTRYANDTLSPKVYPTYYRPAGTNGKNDYTQDSLHSVYFAVPKEVIKERGDMTAVHAKWLDAVLTPGLVTGNQEMFKEFSKRIGKKPGEGESIPYMYWGGDYSYPMSGIVINYGFLFNSQLPIHNVMSNKAYVGSEIETLYHIYNSGSVTNSADNYTLPSEEIERVLKSSAENYGGELVLDRYAACMFESVSKEFTEVFFNADYGFSLTSEVLSKKAWCDLFAEDVYKDFSDKFKDIKAIVEVKEEDLTGTPEEVCDRLLIAEADYNAFIKYFYENKATSTIYLFRYQVTDYISQEAMLAEKKSNFLGEVYLDIKDDSNAYFFQQTLNLDFDVIDVSFGYNQEYVMPVVSNPQDIIHDPTPPVYTNEDKDLTLWITVAILLIAGSVVGIVFANTKK